MVRIKNGITFCHYYTKQNKNKAIQCTTKVNTNNTGYHYVNYQQISKLTKQNKNQNKRKGKGKQKKS